MGTHPFTPRPPAVAPLLTRSLGSIPKSTAVQWTWGGAFGPTSRMSLVPTEHRALVEASRDEGSGAVGQGVLAEVCHKIPWISLVDKGSTDFVSASME